MCVGFTYFLQQFLFPEKQDTMVRCSNIECPFGSWFHLTCLDMQEHEVPGEMQDWWCSRECHETNTSQFCTCKTYKEDSMVQCSRGNACTQGTFFHKSCVHISDHQSIGIYLNNPLDINIFCRFYDIFILIFMYC